MTKEQAFDMGIAAFHFGLTSEPIVNKEFFERVYKEISSEYRCMLMQAYIDGWNSENTK